MRRLQRKKCSRNVCEELRGRFYLRGKINNRAVENVFELIRASGAYDWGTEV